MIKKKISNKIYFNVKNGGLERYYSDTKEKESFGEVGGLPIDLRIVEKDDFDKKSKIKELQLEMWDDVNGGEYYVVCTRLHRSFSDGLILAMANLEDFTEKLIVKAYTLPPKDVSPTFKPATFCSLKKYDNPEEKIKWVEGCPETKTVQYKGQDIKDREERDAFLEALILKIQANIRNNSSLITTKLETVPEEIYDDETGVPGDED
jgi:hypothetical protein